MTKTRDISDLLDANGDVKSSALDNVPPSNDASALTTGPLPDARLSSNVTTNSGTQTLTNKTIASSQLTGALPALDGSALTGISSGVGTVSAWVSFDSRNTPSIISSGNVSSITDIAQGQYDVNFTNAFSNTNYCTVTGGGGEIRNNTLTNVALPDNKRTTSKIGVDTQYNHQNVFEPPYVNLLVIT